MDTAPFHWSGELRNFENLMHDVFQGRMGGPSVDRCTWLPSAAGWTVPAVKTSWLRDPSAIVRGKALFAGAARLRHLPQRPRLHQRRKL